MSAMSQFPITKFVEKNSQLYKSKLMGRTPHVQCPSLRSTVSRSQKTSCPDVFDLVTYTYVEISTYTQDFGLYIAHLVILRDRTRSQPQCAQKSPGLGRTDRSVRHHRK
jgi:hypothetical protein